MNVNEKLIQFAGSKAGGSQRIPIPFELEVDQDIEVTINQHNFTFNVVKQETFSNQERFAKRLLYISLLLKIVRLLRSGFVTQKYPTSDAFRACNE